MEYIIRTPQQLADGLRARRKQLALTQLAAGAGVGLQTKTISALESTPEKSSIRALFKLLSALDFELVLRPKQPRPTESEW